jgi:protocatechuate 3,4-dioxygenase beta subunit
MRFPFLLCGLISAMATFAPAAELSGRVVAEQKGVIGATVSAVPFETRHAVALREIKGEPAPASLATVVTGPDGRFKLAVPPGAPPFVVRVTFGGLAARTLDGVFEKSDTEDLGEISLSRGETVSGRVVDPGGKPMSGALVRIGQSATFVITKADGLFRFEDLQGPSLQFLTQRLALSVHAQGFEIQAAAARFSGAPMTVKLKATTSRVSGLLRDWNGRPAVDAVVRVVGDAASRWARTDATGRFEILGTPARQGRLQALGRDGSSLDTAVTGGAISAPLTLVRSATIEGRVTRLDNGRMVPGVKVTARSGDLTVLARTGVDGRYRLTGLAQESYRLSFDEKSFVLTERRGIDVSAGEVKTLDVALTAAVTLLGRVSDEKGRPIAGARGALSPGSESRMGAIMARLAQGGAAASPAFISGADGTFKATRLAPGLNQKLTVAHAEFERRVVPGLDLIAEAPRPLTVDVVLSPGFVLSGVVKDKDGRTIENASVALNRSVQMTGGRGGNVVSFNTIESVRPQTETDYEGKFGFKGLSAGDYDVTVSRPGYTITLLNAVKAGDGTSPLDVVLNPGAAISGRLVQSTGNPVTGYQVAARPSTPPPGAAMMMGRNNTFVPADPDGGFQIEGLVPGTAYDLSIFGPGESRGDAKLKNVVPPISEVEIQVATRGRLTGRAVDAATGSPLTEFEAMYTQALAGGGGMLVMFRGPGDVDRRTPFTSPDGAFAFEDVPPGNWDVSVWAKTYRPARTGGITLAAGETKTVEVKASRGLVIRGRVVDARGGRPVPDATVTARDAGGPRGMFVFGPEAGGVVTDADGRFEIIDRAPGAYQVTARHAQFSEGSANVTLAESDASMEISLSAGGAIAGVVTSAQGSPLSGAEVALQNSAEGPRFGMEGQSTLTDGVGRFRFDHLAAGRYRVGASWRTEASPLVDVPLNAGDVREDIRLALDAGATVRGMVTGLGDGERGGLMVGAQGGQDYFANTRTTADGSFEFAGVPKGPLTLRATSGDMMGTSRTAVRELVVAEGQTEVTTDIVFEDGLSISGTVTRRGSPVSGARVSAFTSGAGIGSSARADENGFFRITGLKPGRVNVFAFAESFGGQASKIVELTADTSVDLVMSTARLSGIVVDTTGALPLESTVELQRVEPSTSGGGRSMMNATTDSSGRFAFEDLDAVEYRVTARRSGYEAVTQIVKAAESGEDLRIELKRGSGLAVEARDAQMGFGLRSLYVRVTQGTTDAFAGQVSLDGEGKGEIPGIPPGSYSVTAQASGYAPVRLPNILAPSMVVRLAFTPGGAVEFRTTEEFLSGGSKTGQLVSLSGGPVGMGTGGPDSFRLSRQNQRMENLAPGSYRLTLAGGIDKTFEITEGGLAVVAIP